MAKDYTGVKNLKNHPKNHHFLSEPLLVPNVNKTDCNRLTMFCSQLAQTVVNEEGEAPNVLTNFENQVGNYTIDGYKKLDDDYKVIDKIKKNELNYTLILENINTGKVKHVNRSESCWLTEHYGFKYNNTVIDNKQPGSVITKDETLYRSNTYDDDGNLKYGRNMNVAYMTYKNLTLEDPIVISRTAAKKLSYSDVYKVSVSVNTNDLLVNLYGDKNGEYQPFPLIGEYINEYGILCARRRIDYSKLLNNMKDKRLREIDLDDTVFYSDGRVVDIDIYCNMDIDELEEQPYNGDVSRLVTMDVAYRENIVKTVDVYINQGRSDDLDPDLISLYNKCKKVIENNTKKAGEPKNIWVNEGNEFSGYILEFTILKHKDVAIGSKLSGRYGNKGVVSAILPDDMMPTIEEGPFKGEHCEMIMNSLGVLNRLIPLTLGGYR